MEVVALLIAFSVAVWVFSDAKDRGVSGGIAFLWFLGTFALLIIFLPLWLIVRPKLEFVSIVKTTKLCVHCGKYYEGTPSFCPNCGKNI
ncbi:MAG: hypothetical protein WCL34_11055 [Methylococcaceae bacterium]